MSVVHIHLQISKNPFSYEFRKKIIITDLCSAGIDLSRVVIEPLSDYFLSGRIMAKIITVQCFKAYYLWSNYRNCWA